MQEHKHSLSLKLLWVVLLTALTLSLVVSCGQILYQVHQTRQAIDQDATLLLAMFSDSSTQAAHDLDRQMAERVVKGLFQHEAIHAASLGHAGEPLLVERSRALQDTPARNLTDSLFGSTQSFSSPLTEHGVLSLTLDTASYGHAFVRDSLIILLTGILRSLGLALLLYLIYHRQFTKPLQRIFRHLAQINPDRATEQPLPMPMPKGHEHNELGQWIKTSNQLLSSIERHHLLRREAEANLHRIALYDYLTGLPSRQVLQAELQQRLDDAKRHQRMVAVLCLGLDDFREINERFSYHTGDRLLLALADYLRDYSERLDCLSRLSGDQFAMIQTDIAQPHEVAELAQKILDGLDTPFILDGRPIRLRATLGITLFPSDSDNAEELLQKAEQTMTLAKRRSRNRYQFYIASVDREMRHRRELSKDLLNAQGLGQLHLVYQPQLNYPDRAVCGVEVLLRWTHPVHGAIAPDFFIPIAEQSRCILSIGAWVLDKACRQLREWHDQGFDNLRMAVNLSTVQLHHANLPSQVDQLLRHYRLPAGSLELEITETGLMEDIGTAAQNLLSLRRAGALIAIDDFGTGYSSLSYLKSLPLDKIKIDRSFVRDLSEDEDDATIVRTIIQLARNLGMRVIAEGVETSAQERYVIDQGCDEGQGYFYSKPLAAADLTAFLHQTRVPGKRPHALVNH
jgi:diguanylate cyclase (GGDEF)-like protein